MKSIYKNIVIVFAVLCITLVPMFSMVFSTISSKNDANYSNSSNISGEKTSIANSTSKIYLEPEKVDENGVAVSKDNRAKVGFYIKATSAVSNVVVSWRTRDMSAIASQGDYNARESTYTLNGTSSSLIYITIYNKGDATQVTRKLAMLKKNNDLTPDEIVTRNFFIEITSINSDKDTVTIDNSKKQIIASAGYDYCFEVNKITDENNPNNTTSYFSNYNWPNTWSNSSWLSYTPLSERQKTAIWMDKSTNIRDGHKEYSAEADPSNGVFDQYIKRGYAELYASIGADTYEDKWIGGSDNIRVGIVYADNHDDYICQYDIEYKGWSSEHTYDMLQMQTSSRYTTNPGKVLLGDGIVRHYNDGQYYYLYKEEWWEIKNPNEKIQVEFWDYEDYEDRYFYNVRVYTMIADTTAPVVKNYYLQQQSIKQGDKLGLSVRFSEPVQVTGSKKPIISARINNNATYYADFEYVSGSGTDTLYFEWTPTDKNIDITSFTLCDFLNASSIADYSLSMNVVTNPQIFESDDTDSFRGDSSKFTYYDPANPIEGGTISEAFMKHNRLSKPTLDTTMNYSVDMRKPNIYTEVRPSDMASKYVEVPIIIESLNENGKLYYSWANSMLQPDIYDYEVTNLGDIYTIRATDMNGRYYLHLKAVSAYGREQILTVGPFKFDGTPPTINTQVTGNMASRTYKINVIDGTEGADWVAGVDQVKLTFAKDKEGQDIVKEYTYSGDGAKEFNKSVVVSAEDFGLGVDEYDSYYAFVTAYDALGNKSQSEITLYKFDTRTFIDAVFESAYDGKDRVLKPSSEEYKIIDMSGIESNNSVTLRFTTSDTTNAEVDWIVKNSDGKTFKCSGSRGKTVQQITIGGDFASGYYTISFIATESGTTKYSQEMVFYFTRNMQDESLNYYTKINSGTMIINNVFQLNNDLVYYYMDKNGTIQTEKYGNSSKPASFSSSYEAVKYLKYMEYQDLYPIKINRTQADLLNGKSSPNFLKATGETMIAKENQIWIRYKTASFDKDPTTSQWAYYYYQGDTLTLRQEYFSMNLLSSISTAAERLVKNYGGNVVLIGEGNVNQYDEPYLEAEQIHANYESINQTKCGIAFDKAIFYDGDAKIYNSKMQEAGKTYNIATNLEIASNGYNRLFYKSRDNTEYTEIDLTRFNNLSQVITASGVYDLIEADKEGVRKYSVYIDKDAPILTGFIQDADGNTITKEFNKSSQGITYTTKSFTFGTFSELEKDDFAYVSVWKYVTNKTGELLNIYLKSDLEANSYTLSNGDYHIEVYDRSGNGYSFIVRVSSQDFICQTIEKTDEYITVTCNREENEIQSYEIYLDGELLTSKYSKKQNFDQSGMYLIRIIDIFGNEYEYEIDFQRNYPTVTWQYYDESQDEYVNYEDDSKKMKVTRVDETTFRIVTSSLLRFKYDSLYSYQFAGNIDYSENGISHIVRLNKLQNFTLQVGYADYNETVVTYICEIDDTAPNISVKNEIEVFNCDELAYFNSQLELGSIGDTLKYNTISYSKRDIINSYLTSGDVVQSRMLKVSATDNYGVSLIRVYLNDKLLLEETQNFSNIILSRYGNYRIEAYDSYDNKSEFTFTNNIQENLKYYVDGIEKVSNESTIQYFDEHGEFTKIDYGREYVELMLKNNCTIALKITNDETIYSTLELIDGKIYFLTYKIGQDGDDKVISTEKSTAIYDIADSNNIVNDWSLIINQNQCGKNIYAKFDSQNNIYLKIENGDTQTSTIEGRIKLNNVEPFYFRAELSNIKSNVTIKSSEDVKIETNQNENQIKINSAFYIDGTTLSKEIVQIKVYYSLSSTFNEYILVYDNGTFNAQEFSQSGLYLIEIQNIYGNITKYYIVKSISFMATITTELADGKKFNYSSTYKEQVFTNKYIYINAYSANVVCEILKDGQTYTGASKTIENGITIIKIGEQGLFNITVTDEFGNKFKAVAEIKFENLTFDEDLIYGYNENALKKDDGYTNKLLSINQEKLAENNIYYVSIVYSDKESVLIDLISETKTKTANDEILNQCIGKDGDGEYQIIFRDKYGNLMKDKIIHYKSGTTLLLSRTIRSSTDTMDYSIEDVIEKGFWANNSLIFNSNAGTYIFKIDGKQVDCPRTLNFGSGAEEGDFAYQIYYQDEYGNKYEFEAHLFRQKLELIIPSAIKTIEEDGLFVTSDNISLVVPTNTVCTYLLNGEEKTYISNQVLKKDGNYRFTVKDLAGNVSALTIKKDTVVEFEMTEISTNNEVINGGIICTDKVLFTALNGDSSYIKYVFKDGQLIDNYTDNKFSGNGKWEIIIADNIGNQSYFSFQIILHKLNKFDYTVPYGYKITEIWYNSGDDIAISYMQYVKGEGTILNLVENGKYSVVMSSTITGLSSSFTITINNAKPQIALVGCNENETTLNDITISGYKVGDRIDIYRDKKLYKSVEILTSQTDAPTITEGGNYTIVVTNEAGVSTTISFVKKHIPNTSGNVLIIVLILIVALVVFIGLIYRQRSKVDE